MNNIEFIQEALRLYEKYPTKYQLGTFFNKKDEAGNYLTDCTGLLKAVIWHYPEYGNYRKEEDQNDQMMLADSIESGSISSIPEILGLIVWQAGHAGIYLGNGQVLESTAKIWANGKGNALVISQFKDPKGEMYRGTWEKWFKYRMIEYEGEEQEMVLKEGRNDFTYLGKKIIVYKQKSDQELGMISASGNPVYKAVLPIDQIDDSRIHYCKVNCNYFDLNTHQHYGPEVTPQVELIPREAGYLALYQRKDTKKIEYCNSTEFWLSKEAVQFVCCPFAVLYHDGKEVSVRSTAFTNKLGQANTQTFLLQFKDMSSALCICTGGLTPQQCLSFAKQLDDLIHLSVYDSGGSTQMIIDGVKIWYTGRAIANVFTFYKGEGLPEEPEKDSGMLISTGNKKLNIREQPVNGKVLTTVGTNEYIEILDFLDGLKSDGYQWAKVKWNGITGYSQIDTAYIALKEKNDKNSY